jgi:hypothetical protein
MTSALTSPVLGLSSGVSLGGALACALACALLTPAEAWAQCFAPSALEVEAKVALHNGERNTARARVEAALAAHSEPVLAAYVLSQLYVDAEGNFPKALYWVRRAERWLLRACGDRPAEAEAQRMHRDLILYISYVQGDMDLREDQLQTLERYETLYQPPKDDLKIWPLVKLGRFEEARAHGLRLIQSEDPYERSRAFNGLMAVECEARNRKKSYEWGLKGHADAREQSCVIALNLALAARQCYSFDEEERLNRLALNAQERDCSSSPLIQSSATYLIRGEFQKSISALSAWAPRDAGEWSTSHMRVKARRAELMYSLGVWRRGLKEIHDVVTYPDRSAGTDSASEEMLNLEASVLYWALLDAVIVEERERLSARGGGAWLTGSPRLASLAFRRWKQRRQIIRYASHEALLVDVVRPYFSNVMPWYLNTLAHTLGGGVVRGAIAEARRLEAEDFPKESNAYLDALEAELLWSEGDASETLRLAEQALAGIPEQARLIRYRVMALRWAARAALTGDSPLDDDLHALLSAFPTPLRWLDLRLPARLAVRGGALADAAAAALARSPRFALSDGAPLTLEVVEEGAGESARLQVCLFGRGQLRYACAETLVSTAAELERRERRRGGKGEAHRVAQDRERAPEEGEVQVSRREEEVVMEPDPVLRVVDLAHQRLLSPKVELTQRELDTLDGNIRQVSGEEALEGVF